MLLRVTAQVGVNGLVPELLDSIPILDLSTLQEEAHIVRLLLRLRLLSDVEVQLRVAKLVFLANSSLLRTWEKDFVKTREIAHVS